MDSWKGGGKDMKTIYREYLCALQDLNKMSNEQIKIATAVKTTTEQELSAMDPLRYRDVLELSAAYPRVFRDNPCSASEKPLADL